jgi:uncharacterized membrane protein YeaQ/YmgE (transglycosylase-associated protein family)
MILFIISLLVVGLIVGALGRLIHPGRDNMSVLATIGIGIVAMLIAGLIVKPLLGFGGGFITAVIVSIALVALYARMGADGSGRLAR